MFVLSLTVSLSLSLISILRLQEWRQCLITIWRLQTQVTIWRNARERTLAATASARFSLPPPSVRPAQTWLSPAGCVSLLRLSAKTVCSKRYARLLWLLVCLVTSNCGWCCKDCLFTTCGSSQQFRLLTSAPNHGPKLH